MPVLVSLQLNLATILTRAPKKKVNRRLKLETKTPGL